MKDGLEIFEPKGRNTYEHRGCLILPDVVDGVKCWLLLDYGVNKRTLKEAKNYIDQQVGGTARKVIPKRWEDRVNGRPVK